jgi:hypothetical protein
MNATKQSSITVDIDEQEDTTLAQVSLRTPAGRDDGAVLTSGSFYR